MDLILISPPFYILRQNKKISMRLLAHHFESTILKLLMREERKRKEFSTLFYYLPLITDRKETINVHKNNANLTPIYCPLTLIESFASKKGTSFNPQLLNSTNPEHRNPQVEMSYGCLDK